MLIRHDQVFPHLKSLAAKFQDLKRRTQHFVDTVLVGLPCRVVNGPGQNGEKLPWQKTVVVLAVHVGQQPIALPQVD